MNPEAATVIRARRRVRVSAVAIGASAGGVEALILLLPELCRAPLRASVLVVQHLSASRESHLAEILARRTGLTVTKAVEGESPDRGRVYTAPSDRHLMVGEGPRLHLAEGPPVNFVRPSVDVLFESVADVFGESAVAVVLTGTGRDGADGSRKIHDAGGVVVVQDPETSSSSGMPEAAVATGIVDAVLPLGEIGAFVQELMGGAAGWGS